MIKLIIAAFIGCIVGVGAGYEIASRMFFPKLTSDIGLALHSIDSEQRYATVISLGALMRLEAGETEKAKSMLARQIAYYHDSYQKFDDSLPDSQKLRPTIETTSTRSPTLKDELAKKPK